LLLAPVRGSVLVVASVTLGVSACGSEQPAASLSSGVFGRVSLGPTCPVETPDQPCPDRPAADVRVVVTELPADASSTGALVAAGRTDAKGDFRIALAPDHYLMTAEAGMSCKPVEIRVTQGRFTVVELACDTGIR
jgi:hypothetical protein